MSAAPSLREEAASLGKENKISKGHGSPEREHRGVAHAPLPAAEVTHVPTVSILEGFANAFPCPARGGSGSGGGPGAAVEPGAGADTGPASSDGSWQNGDGSRRYFIDVVGPDGAPLCMVPLYGTELAISLADMATAWDFLSMVDPGLTTEALRQAEARRINRVLTPLAFSPLSCITQEPEQAAASQAADLLLNLPELNFYSESPVAATAATAATAAAVAAEAVPPALASAAAPAAEAMVAPPPAVPTAHAVPAAPAAPVPEHVWLHLAHGTGSTTAIPVQVVSPGVLVITASTFAEAWQFYKQLNPYEAAQLEKAAAEGVRQAVPAFSFNTEEAAEAAVAAVRGEASEPLQGEDSSEEEDAADEDEDEDEVDEGIGPNSSSVDFFSQESEISIPDEAL